MCMCVYVHACDMYGSGVHSHSVQIACHKSTFLIERVAWGKAAQAQCSSFDPAGVHP